jgi:hypothetical protein
VGIFRGRGRRGRRGGLIGLGKVSGLGVSNYIDRFIDVFFYGRNGMRGEGWIGIITYHTTIKRYILIPPFSRVPPCI